PPIPGTGGANGPDAAGPIAAAPASGGTSGPGGGAPNDAVTGVGLPSPVNTVDPPLSAVLRVRLGTFGAPMPLELNPSPARPGIEDRAAGWRSRWGNVGTLGVVMDCVP